jgi:cyclopropane-fatty-acyl-phospholipid synthase
MSAQLQAATESNISHAPRDEGTFFDLVGPALKDEPLEFRCGERSYRFGPETDRTVVKVNDPRVFRDVLAKGNLGLAESYVAKKVEIVQGSLERLLISLARSDIEQNIWQNPVNVLRVAPILARNLLRGRYKNVQSHYDIGEDLFEAFLDPSMAYSCGYVASETDTLADLQVNKFERICRKLRLQRGDTLLDIGCGFGGLLIHAAKHYGARCTGITISRHHHRRARANVEAQGLSGEVEIVFASHKELPGKFNKVVSVGMIEHLTQRDFPVFIRNIKAALTPNAIGLLHTVGCSTFKNRRDPFIQKYMLPGTRTPKLSEMADCLERNDLPVLDVENIVRHYAPTLRGWNENFQKNYPALDHRKYDETFKRIWEYSFACCIAFATASEAAVYQVLFTNSKKLEIPWQRV